MVVDMGTSESAGFHGSPYRTFVSTTSSNVSVDVYIYASCKIQLIPLLVQIEFLFYSHLHLLYEKPIFLFVKQIVTSQRNCVMVLDVFLKILWLEEETFDSKIYTP